MRRYVEHACFDSSSCFHQAYNNTTRIDHLNYIAYMGGHHKYMFDKENLLHILKSLGFSSVSLRAFDPRIDTRAEDSIFVEAKK